MAKLALITGASSGIGLEFAHLLAADHYDLILAARDKKTLEKIAKDLQNEHRIKIIVVGIDLSDKGAADKLWRHTKGKELTILINNAGFGDLANLTNAKWDKLNSMINLNITTLTRLSQLAAQNMQLSQTSYQKHILNVASIAAFFPGPGMAVYYATKSYVLSFSAALAEELANSNIFVTTLCPGPTKTGFSTAAGVNNSNLFKGNIPTAKDVAEYGYKMMFRKKTIAVHGVKNKFIAFFLPKIIPRKILIKTIYKKQNTH